MAGLIRPPGMWAGRASFDPAEDPLATAFFDGFCTVQMFDDLADEFNGVANDAGAPTVGNWRIQSITDRVGGFIFTAPSIAERLTWNHTTKRFEGDGNRRLRVTTGQPQGIFPDPDFTIFMDANFTVFSGRHVSWEFGTNSSSERSSFSYALQTAGTFNFEPRSFSGGGQNNALVWSPPVTGERLLLEGWVSGLNSRLLRDATLINSKADNDSGFASDGSGFGIFGRNPVQAGVYFRGTSAGIWMFKGGVTTDFEASFRTWVTETFP